MRKLRSHSGETLVETLAALLLIALTSAVFLQAVLSSAHSGAEAKKDDGLFRQNLSAAERQDAASGTDGSVTVDGKAYAVTYYQSGAAAPAGGRLRSYAAKEEGG